MNSGLDDQTSRSLVAHGLYKGTEVALIIRQVMPCIRTTLDMSLFIAFEYCKLPSLSEINKMPLVKDLSFMTPLLQALEIRNERRKNCTPVVPVNRKPAMMVPSNYHSL